MVRKHELAILAMLGVSVVMLIASIAYATKPTVNDTECPDGQYAIEQGICKDQPSDCPHHEFVTEKGCVAPPDIECNNKTGDCHSTDNLGRGNDNPEQRSIDTTRAPLNPTPHMVKK